MPSKGLDLYTYISLDGCEVSYEVPHQSITKNNQREFSKDHLEVDKKNLGGLKVSGRFSFTVRRNGQEITNQWCDVNTLSGNVEGGTMKTLAEQKAIVHDDVVVCYGFYDAGQGNVGLPKCHQVYVTVTPNKSHWMGDVAPDGSSQASQTLQKFVLPAAHDIGMNSMEQPDAMVRNGGKAFIETLAGAEKSFATIASEIATPIAAGIAPDIICSLSITQTNSVDAVLNIGARYFEFRPAHVFDKVRGAIPDRLYFMHGPIPGMLYDNFLHDVVEFLKSHSSEIVVFQLRWDGVPGECARASDDELRDALDNALRDSGINVGNLDDVRNTNIQDLRSQGKRLIVLRDCSCYSTYDDLANATLNGESMLAKFEALQHDQQGSHDLTNIQCQATATNIRNVVIHSAISSDASNSCLLATKAICDARLLPWVRDHALEKLSDDGLVLLMNDFFDGATADVAIELTRRRLG